MKSYRRAALLGAVALVLAGCGGGETEGGADPQGQADTPDTAAQQPPGEPVYDMIGDLPEPGTYHTTHVDDVQLSFSVDELPPEEETWLGEVPEEEFRAALETWGEDPSRYLPATTRWAIVGEGTGLPYVELIRRLDPDTMATSWGITVYRFTFPQSPRELAAELHDQQLATGDPAFTAPTEPEPVEYGEASGIQFEGTVNGSLSLPSPFVRYQEGKRIRFIALDVEGFTKAITLEAPAEDFAGFAEEAEALLRTIRWWPGEA